VRCLCEKSRGHAPIAQAHMTMVPRCQRDAARQRAESADAITDVSILQVRAESAAPHAAVIFATDLPAAPPSASAPATNRSRSARYTHTPRVMVDTACADGAHDAIRHDAPARRMFSAERERCSADVAAVGTHTPYRDEAEAADTRDGNTARLHKPFSFAAIDMPERCC